METKAVTSLFAKPTSSAASKYVKNRPGWVEVFQRISNEPRVKDLVRFSSNVFKETEPFLKQPNWWNAARGVLGVFKVYLDEYEIWPDSFFEQGDWERIYDSAFGAIVLSAINEAGSVNPIVIKTIDGPMVIRVHEFETFKLGYSFSTKMQRISGDVYIDGNVADCKSLITEMTWRRLKTDSVLYKFTKSRRDDDEAANFVTDSGADPLDSPKAEKYASYIQKCMSKGINRSLMFYGPPGTGKSTLARAVVKALGLKSLRIRVEDIAYINNTQVTEMFSLLNPDVIILDDFDRASNQAALLETLEHFSRNVKVIIATVNDRRSLDNAILRPGRFDEMVLVDQMEENVIRHLLGPECQDAYGIVHDWPIAFINEYVKRRKVFTKEEAESSLEELLLRVAEIEESTKRRNVDNPEARFMDRMKTLASRKLKGDKELKDENILEAASHMPEEEDEADDGPFVPELSYQDKDDPEDDSFDDADDDD